MASVKILLRKDKISKKNDKAPLYIRITQDRKSRFLSLGISVEPKYWNENKSTIKKGATNYKELNAYILQKRAEIERTSLDLNTRSKRVTSNTIKEKISHKKDLDFFTYCTNKLEELKISLTYSTYSEYKVRLGKFKKYYGNKELFFDEITLEFLNKYTKYQFEELKNKPYTVINNIKLIKNMSRYAHEEGVQGIDLSIFRKHKIQAKQETLKYLTEEQLKQILEYDKSKLTQKQEIYFDMFVFACYSGGLRFSDIIDLRWNDYIEKEQRIVKLIKKTKRTHQVKLTTKANSIIIKYKRKDKNKEDYIFPLLKYIDGEIITDKRINNRISQYNNKSNTLLKIIAEKINLPFKLTFHSSRHTFATIALKRGMRIEYVSKILGHANINTTQVYAKIINKELDKAMEIMDF